MTNEEIKKGLEFCKADWCVMCPYCNCIGCEGFLKQDALNLITEQEKDIKQLKTECSLLDDELRIARQDTIDVLNKVKEKLNNTPNGWAYTTYIDELLKEY